MLQQRDGSFTDNDSDVANVLNAYFCSVFTREDLNTIPTLPVRNYNSTLSDIQITPDDVLLQLQRLQPHKSVGPDHCHPYILYNVCHSIITPITLIFDQSLKEGSLPVSWREATVVAIHKKGPKTDACIYRPVSLTSVVCKMLESIIKDHIMQHLASNSLLNDHQYGFHPGRPCELQVLRILNDWTRYADNKIPVDILYLGYQKAFDKVPRQRLIFKLQAYGIDGNVLS